MSYSVRLPLPPTTNQGYKTGLRFMKGRGWVSRLMKTDRLIAWEDVAAYETRHVVRPKGAPLSVAVRLEVHRGDLRRCDIDGYLKYLLDQVVGKRNDQWIDRLSVVKVEGDGWATVTVEEAERCD